MKKVGTSTVVQPAKANYNLRLCKARKSRHSLPGQIHRAPKGGTDNQKATWEVPLSLVGKGRANAVGIARLAGERMVYRVCLDAGY